MSKKDVNDVFSSEDQSLLDCLSASYLSMEDVRWLKSKRWFKRFLKIYSKELKKRYKNKPVIKKEIKPLKEDIEVLDFTQSIKMPSKEVIEILDFTKTLDITDINGIVKANEKAKKKVKLEKNIWAFVITICSFILIILMVILINWYLENKKTNEVLDTIYEAAELEEKPVTTTTSESNETTIKEPTLYDIYGNMSILEVNFDNLKNINPDTVGWIKVNGTKINYPFVHTTDNDYYLKHTFDKTSNKKGWVYLDYRNDINNLSKNNILYAHGLVTNEMFGSMRKTLKPSWYKNKDNQIITIATPSGNLKWQVFSVYTIEPESYYITTSFSDDEKFNTFLQTIKSRSIYDFGVELTKDDKILTLSSCYDDEKRMVLHAKLIG